MSRPLPPAPQNPAAQTPQLRRAADLLARHGLNLQPDSEASRIRRLTCYDTLTGLPNRLLLREQLELMLRLAQRQGHGVAVLLVDIDDFRRLKHTLGHRRSDELVKAVSQRLQAALRRSDLVSQLSTVAGSDRQGALARLAGNEFAVVLGVLPDPRDAERVARRLREAASVPLQVNGTDLYPTVSVGIALSATDGHDAEELLEKADLALGRANEQGRDRTQFYNAEMDATAAQRLEVETGLRHALAGSPGAGQFVLEFQPRVDGRTGEASSCEALVRWRHPQRGLLMPGAFIEVAETSHLIVPIGRWVMEEACRQNRRWQREGVPPMPVGVNVSALQICRPDFAATVARALDLSGLMPHWLELEVTETALLQDQAAALQALTAVKQLGVRLAIDDFGTGYSSLGYLRDFPFDVLKIDRSFTERLPQDARTAAITQGIVDLSRRLGLEVVAEGVETDAQRCALLEYGCIQMQGYLFSRPVAPQALAGVWVDDPQAGDPRREGRRSRSMGVLAAG